MESFSWFMGIYMQEFEKDPKHDISSLRSLFFESANSGKIYLHSGGF